MDTSDVEALGIDSAFAEEMAEDHLEYVEHWANPRWTSADTRHFGGSYTPSSLSGPPLSDILKQILSWEKLSDLSATGWQGFYKKLRRYSFKWKISLVPFEAISLNYEYMGHNLCHCGLGLARFRKMGDALFIILENLLPTSNTTITTTLDTLANSPRTANGYELLWTLLKEFIPMLDRTKPTPFPSWSDASDILQYGRLVLMYCDLARHHGPPYTAAMKSRMFLTNVRGPYVQLSTQYNASDLVEKRDQLLGVMANNVRTDLRGRLQIAELLRLMAYSYDKPVRQIPWQGTDQIIDGLWYALATPTQLEANVQNWLHPPRPKIYRPKPNHTKRSKSPAARIPMSNASNASAQQAGVLRPFGWPVYLPTRRPPGSIYIDESPRAYQIPDLLGNPRPAYRAVMVDRNGHSWGIQGVGWDTPPLVKMVHQTVQVGSKHLNYYWDGGRMRFCAIQVGGWWYWVSNSLSRSITSAQMMSTCSSFTRFR
jgi:hypothetical protein